LPLSKLGPNAEPLNIENHLAGKIQHGCCLSRFFICLDQAVFSEIFGRVVYLWNNYDQTNIEAIMNFFKPEIVVEERAERRPFEGLSD